MEFDFPRTPSGTLKELWGACFRLLPQLSERMLKDIAVGTAETPIAHGQKDTPRSGLPILKANVNVWQTRDPDDRFFYFQASVATTIDVKVIR